jgi:hypothetical protein
VLVLLVVPGVSLLAGTFFGGWRGLLVSVLSIGGSAYLINNAHLSLFKGFPQAGLLELLPFALSALIVGWIYSSRKYAAWWLSWFVQMLGAFVLLLGILIVSAILDSMPGTNYTSSSNAIGVMLSVGTCAVLAIAVPYGLLITIVEGLIHHVIASFHKER